MDPNDVTVLVTVNSSYFLTTNSVKRVMGGMWLNDEVPKYYYLYIASMKLSMYYNVYIPGHRLLSSVFNSESPKKRQGFFFYYMSCMH